MNVRLYDGTVRCAEHYDASSYESETSDLCLYCPAGDLSADDQAWLEAQSALVVEPPRRTLTVSKIQCDRCANSGTWKISDEFGKVEQLCTDHGQEWHPNLFPQVSVS